MKVTTTFAEALVPCARADRTSNLPAPEGAQKNTAFATDTNVAADT